VKWLFLLLGVVIGVLIMFLVRWLRSRGRPTTTVVSHGDDEPLADETPTGQIPVLGPRFGEPALSEADLEPEPASWEPGSYVNSAKPTAGGASPAGEFTVKGNTGSMLYHTKESPYYTRTRAEVWFRTPVDAEAAGFTEWNKRRERVS
jgi:hypothetical protein